MESVPKQPKSNISFLNVLRARSTFSMSISIILVNSFSHCCGCYLIRSMKAAFVLGAHKHSLIYDGCNVCIELLSNAFFIAVSFFIHIIQGVQEP